MLAISRAKTPFLKRLTVTLSVEATFPPVDAHFMFCVEPDDQFSPPLGEVIVKESLLVIEK